MTRLLFLTIALIFSVHIAFSQNLELAVFLIPEELKEDANSVVRFENTTVIMESQRKMTIRKERAVTIYNKLADKYADLTIHYDKRRTIKNIKMYVYDAIGNEIKKIKKGDFDDYSSSDGISLFSDGRLIHYNYTPITYPYTVYYTYEISTSNTAFINSWMPVRSCYQSIQNSTFTFQYPPSIAVNKKEINFENYEVEVSEKNNTLIYGVKNIKAIESEPYSPLLTDIVPIAKFGVNKFNLEGVDGEADNWQEFGKWYYNTLLMDTSEIPEKTKQEVLALTSEFEDPIEKAKIVYAYVQDKVRYISIQVGIGGFKPMLASDVDNLSYGDCKALSNYTKSLLKVVGVASNYTIIYGNRGKVDIEEEFLSVQGNHVILNIPSQDGNLWLECTMQNIPFADIAGFTDDRKALVITPEGGMIKHTRVYDDKENLQSIVGKYVISNNGDIKGNIVMTNEGSQFLNRLKYEGRNSKDQDKLYKEFWDNIDNMTLKKIDVVNNKNAGKFEESVSFVAENYSVISGARLIFPVNAFNVIETAPKRIRNRKLPIEVVRGYYNVDEVEIELPKGFNIEAKSENVNVDTKYGSYTMTIEVTSENTLNYKRIFLLKTGKYPKEEYNDYRNFWRQVVKNDKSKIVLIKN